MDFNLDLKLEKFISESTLEQFPDAIKNRVKMCLIDLLCVLILGTQSKQYKVGISIAQQMGFLGNISVFGTDDTYNLLGALIIIMRLSNEKIVKFCHSVL